MNIEELIGSQVWVKQRGGPEWIGRISSTPRPVIRESIESSVSASTFRIDLPSGDVLETIGVNIQRIEHDQYQKETSGRPL